MQKLARNAVRRPLIRSKKISNVFKSLKNLLGKLGIKRLLDANGNHSLPTVANIDTKLAPETITKDKPTASGLENNSGYIDKVMQRSLEGKLSRLNSARLLSDYTDMPLHLAKQHIANTNAVRSLGDSKEAFSKTPTSIPVFSNATIPLLESVMYGSVVPYYSHPRDIRHSAFYSQQSLNKRKMPAMFVNMLKNNTALHLGTKDMITAASRVALYANYPDTLVNALRRQVRRRTKAGDAKILALTLQSNGIITKNQADTILRHGGRHPEKVLKKLQYKLNEATDFTNRPTYRDSVFHEGGGHGFVNIQDMSAVYNTYPRNVFKPGHYFANPGEGVGALSRIRSESSALFANKHGRLPGMELPDKTGKGAILTDKDKVLSEIKEALDLYRNPQSNPRYNTLENLRIRNQYTENGAENLEGHFLEPSNIPGNSLPNWFRYGIGFGIPTLGVASQLNNNANNNGYV